MKIIKKLLGLAYIVISLYLIYLLYKYMITNFMDANIETAFIYWFMLGIVSILLHEPYQHLISYKYAPFYNSSNIFSIIIQSVCYTIAAPVTALIVIFRMIFGAFRLIFTTKDRPNPHINQQINNFNMQNMQNADNQNKTKPTNIYDTIRIVCYEIQNHNHTCQGSGKIKINSMDYDINIAMAQIKIDITADVIFSNDTDTTEAVKYANTGIQNLLNGTAKTALYAAKKQRVTTQGRNWVVNVELSNGFVKFQ